MLATTLLELVSLWIGIISFTVLVIMMLCFIRLE